MKNNKGFTLTEVLLAVMIVGVVGVALAALTGAAVRESSIGRTRMMLRNQLSSAMRQLRQDVHLSSKISGCSGSFGFTLQQDATYPIGPNHTPQDVTYALSGTTITRNGETWLTDVKVEPAGDFIPAKCELIDTGDGTVKSAMRIRLAVGVNSNPPVTETIEKFFVLPHGFGYKYSSGS